MENRFSPQFRLCDFVSRPTNLTWVEQTPRESLLRSRSRHPRVFETLTIYRYCVSSFDLLRLIKLSPNSLSQRVVPIPGKRNKKSGWIRLWIDCGIKRSNELSSQINCLFSLWNILGNYLFKLYLF